MTAMIDRPKLRALAEASLEASEPVPGAEGDPFSLLRFNAKANPRTVLALLDDLDAHDEDGAKTQEAGMGLMKDLEWCQDDKRSLERERDQFRTIIDSIRERIMGESRCADDSLVKYLDGVLVESDQSRADLNTANVAGCEAEGQIAQLRTELSDTSNTLRLAQKTVGTLTAENMCDVCAGAGKPTSGDLCMCDGTGKMSVAALELRSNLFAAMAKNEHLSSELQEARETGVVSSGGKSEVRYQKLLAEQERDRIKAENERLIKREDELEQAVADLNAFDAPVELQKERALTRGLKAENERLKTGVHAVMSLQENCPDGTCGLPGDREEEEDWCGYCRAQAMLERLIGPQVGSIAEDEQLSARVEALEGALSEAATSLETLGMAGSAEDRAEFLRDTQDVRDYANSRFLVAQSALDRKA